MKKITSLMVVLTMLAGMFMMTPVISNAEGLSGDGTAESPYLLDNAADLLTAGEMVNAVSDATGAAAAVYKLTADIDMTGQEWIPIGTNQKGFAGTFIGDNHIVKNLTMTLAETDTFPANTTAGFFGRCTNATVSGLGVENLVIDFTNGSASASRIKFSGGMAGQAWGATFTDCYVSGASIKNNSTGRTDTDRGGFIGLVEGSNTFTNCYAYDIVMQTAQECKLGGFFGEINNTGNVFENCFSARVRYDLGEAVQIPTTYGFGYDPKTGNNYEKCYSDLADRQGSYTNAPAYDSTKSVGVTAMTKTALVNAVSELEMFTVDNKHNGYPYLDFNTTITAATAYKGGTGTEDDPYQIENAAQLKKFEEEVNGGSYTKCAVLIQDIDLKNNEWIPIGHNTVDGSYQFAGTFNGGEHIIKNFKITNELTTPHFNYIGLFGNVNGGHIINLGIGNMTVEARNRDGESVGAGTRIKYIGGIAGALGGSSTVNNCFVKNSSIRMVRRNSQSAPVGGFIGGTYGTPTINNSYTYNTSVMSAYGNPMGGFAGRLEGGAISNCYVTGAQADYSDPITNQNITSTVYGFAEEYSGTNSLTNCISNLSSSIGSGNSGVYLFNGTLKSSQATTSASEDAIKSSFANVAGFKTDTSINNGLPCLSWEKTVREYDFTIVSVAKNASDDMLTVRAEGRDVDNVTLYIATYDDNGRFIDVGSAVLEDGVATIKCDIGFSSAKTVKAFVWDGYQTPLAMMYSGTRSKINNNGYNLIESGLNAL